MNRVVRKQATRPRYERDFHGWCFEQAALLDEGRLGELDRARLAEEMRDLGRSELNALVSAYRVLLMHMLKWDHQPERRSRSWQATIAVQRSNISDLLEDNDSLANRAQEVIARAYPKARNEAAGETNLKLSVFPKMCPYSETDILLRPFVMDGDDE
jgi:hypothetical protein